jgi:hypothetical protein
MTITVPQLPAPHTQHGDTPAIPSVQPESPPSPPPLHDERGKFAKGNKAAVVNNGKKRTPWSELFVHTLSEENFCKIVMVLVDKALKGDQKAAQFILNKCLGNSLEITTPTQSSTYISPEELRTKLLAQLELTNRTLTVPVMSPQNAPVASGCVPAPNPTQNPPEPVKPLDPPSSIPVPTNGENIMTEEKNG